MESGQEGNADDCGEEMTEEKRLARAQEAERLQDERARAAAQQEAAAQQKAAARRKAAEEAEAAAAQKAAAIARMSHANAPVIEKKNPVVFLEIGIDGNSVGHVEIELYADVVPKTAENFRCLCTGERGRSESRNRLHFAGSAFHRIVPGFMCQGGDFTEGDGTGGESIYGEKFDDENFKRKHAKGCLSMANGVKNTNGSQFFICTSVTSHLDGKHVVFGEVTRGYDVVERMEAVGSASGKTRKRVLILSCGMVNTDDAQEAKRPRVVDVAPAARIVHDEPQEPLGGGLLGLLQARDAQAEGCDSGIGAGDALNVAVPQDDDEAHVLHILRKHTGSRKPKSRGGAPITCSHQEAEEYLEEIGVQFLDLEPQELRRRFSELARTESDCSSAKKGGDYGRFSRGQREQSFEDATFALKIGEMSDIVHTASGVHLILRVP